MDCKNCSECESCKQKKEKRLQDKLQGEVYFSSPLDFNDILGSQLESNYNNNDIDTNRFILKLRELFYKEIEETGINLIDEYIRNFDKIKNGNKEIIENLRKKQLENTGILCFTDNNTNATMWGYYADNTGICIEYDTRNLIFDIVTDLVSKMSPDLTNLLIEKKYNKSDRDISTKPKRTQFAKEIFCDKTEVSKSIKNNKVLLDRTAEERVFFVQNVYTKRLWGRKVQYCSSSELTKIKSSLFDNKTELKITGKYFTKNEFWQHENEYRFILSLGGRKVIKLREKTIKSITFGYNTEIKVMNNIKEIINKSQFGNSIKFKKINVENNNLIAKELN